MWRRVGRRAAQGQDHSKMAVASEESHVSFADGAGLFGAVLLACQDGVPPAGLAHHSLRRLELDSDSDSEDENDGGCLGNDEEGSLAGFLVSR